MIQFGVSQSYLFYYSSIIFASIFAGMAQKINFNKKRKHKVNLFFWTLSFLCLFIPLAFRGFGVDHYNYLATYYTIKRYGWSYFKIYTGFPEPLFVVINIIASYLGKFQYVYVISAFISLFFSYISFSRKVNEISLAICIWMFSTLFYLNLFGLVRMGIAVSIITYAYKYIEENNFKQYFFYIIIATLFHYSAIIMLPLYFIYKNNKFDLYRTRNIRKSWISLIILGILFFASYYIIKNFSSEIIWLNRYKNYFLGTSISVIKNSAGQFPIILLIILFWKIISKKEKYGQLYISMLITLIIFTFGSIIVSLIRLTYYFYPATYFLYAYVAKYIGNTKMKILYNYIMFIIMSLWFFYRFTSNLWGPFLVPYYFNIF